MIFEVIKEFLKKKATYFRSNINIFWAKKEEK